MRAFKSLGIFLDLTYAKYQERLGDEETRQSTPRPSRSAVGYRYLPYVMSSSDHFCLPTDRKIGFPDNFSGSISTHSQSKHSKLLYNLCQLF
ncbi:hypothetical protein J6590_001962 [Homalodisca vitripennis]|nr:hypothetical protein J6590_001962 [Homalodisca vitripennis]